MKPNIFNSIVNFHILNLTAILKTKNPATGRGFVFYLDKDQTASPLLTSGGPEKY
ncbi:uncharacterized protein METZ01_LOCUS334314 [marine metagenome]|uniref:Uncharacterized protein n=1 Tax=marine metagenome TaxID=408172 RepID=A0A382Q924_9ZZZZ